MRSLASELHRGQQVLDFHYDVFTGNLRIITIVDLDEQLSAFDHHAIIKQSEFVQSVIRGLLSRYPKCDHFPIIAHSMGGIVAKHALLNIDSNKSWTLISIATPHKRPPFSISRELLKLFLNINQEWDIRKNSSILVSISGGILDTMISSDLTRAENAIMMYAPGMVDVWTGADHKMLLWCNQLIVKLSRFLLSEYKESDGNHAKTSGFLQGIKINTGERLVNLSDQSFGISGELTNWMGNGGIYQTFNIGTEKVLLQIFARYEFHSRIIGCTSTACYEILGYESIVFPVEPRKLGRTDVRKVGQFEQFSSRSFPELVNVTIGISPEASDPKVQIGKYKTCQQSLSVGVIGIFYLFLL